MEADVRFNILLLNGFHDVPDQWRKRRYTGVTVDNKNPYKNG